MGRSKKENWIQKTGALLILIGAMSIFPENDTWIHTSLQITFFVGCITFLFGNRAAKNKSSECSSI